MGECRKDQVKASTTKRLYPSPSSLVRRARLIRRCTSTDQYCEYLKDLKKLGKRDGVVIHQILIFRLKPWLQATTYEKACSSGCSTSGLAYIPSVDFTYPHLQGADSNAFPPPLFFPDFTKYQRPSEATESREAYSVILTNERGERTFAYCFKFTTTRSVASQLLTTATFAEEVLTGSTQPFNPHSVLVFVSHYPHEQLLHRLAADFITTLQKDSEKLHIMCRDLLHLRVTTSEESVRRCRYLLSYHASIRESDSFQWAQTPISTAIRQLGVYPSLLLFLSLLAEKRIIVTGSSVSDVSRAVQSFVRLLAPLHWPHTLIPILPDGHAELCHNPTPYICGILRYNLAYVGVRELLCAPIAEFGDRVLKYRGDDVNKDVEEKFQDDEVIMIDVEMGVILPCLTALMAHDQHPAHSQRLTTNAQHSNKHAIVDHCCSMGFPRSAITELAHSFKDGLAYNDAGKADQLINKRIMICYAKLFGHYRRLRRPNSLTAKNRKRFAEQHPCEETRLFLKWFIEGSLLQAFIASQLDDDSPRPSTSGTPLSSTLKSDSSSSGESLHSSASIGNSDRIAKRFERILERYAPPVVHERSGNGKRAKALIWRIFRQ